MIIFPRIRISDTLKVGAPPGSIIVAQKKGWVTTSSGFNSLLSKYHQLTRKTKRKPPPSHNAQAVCITDDSFVDKLKTRKGDKSEKPHRSREKGQKKKLRQNIHWQRNQNIHNRVQESPLNLMKMQNLIANVLFVASTLESRAISGYNVTTVKNGMMQIAQALAVKFPDDYICDLCS